MVEASKKPKPSPPVSLLASQQWHPAPGVKNVRDESLNSIGKMPQYVLQAYNKIKESLSEATKNDARARYDIALLIKQVWDKDCGYGKRAMSQLAAAIGWNTATIYRYKDIAEHFSRDEFERLLERDGKYGRPLSWRHFFELLKVGQGEERQKLLDAVIDDGLSARQLGKLISTSQSKRPRAKPKKSGNPPREAIQELTTLNP